MSTTSSSTRHRAGRVLTLAIVALVAGGMGAAVAGSMPHRGDPRRAAAPLRWSVPARHALGHRIARLARGPRPRLLAWRAPRVPPLHQQAPRIITPPPRVVTIVRPAARFASQPARAGSAPARREHDDERGGEGGDE